tara:strand:+ start:35877 stop:36065 length:189 start_codon:yes stop_codon:yes gene_type:complete
MNIHPKPITPHKLSPPMGTNPAHLQRLINRAAEQYVLADESAQVDYLIYIKKCRQKIERALP